MKCGLNPLKVYEKQENSGDSPQIESIQIDTKDSKVQVLIGNAPITRDGERIVNYVFYIDITGRKKILKTSKNLWMKRMFCYKKLIAE